MQSRRNNDGSLGEFETLVLMAIMRLGENAYGMTIHLEIEKRTGRRCSFGALYTTLDRMEAKGYVASSLGEVTAERGGRAKKYFRLKAHGASCLRQSYAATVSMAEGIEGLLEGAR